MISAPQPTTPKPPSPMVVGLAAALLIGCALSAGAHFRLAPEHMAESPLLGMGFIVAGILLVALGVGAFFRPYSPGLTLALAVLLAALILAYAVSRTAGLPVVHPERETVDAVGLVTKVVEIAAMALALRLRFGHRSWRVPLPKPRRNTWTTY